MNSNEVMQAQQEENALLSYLWAAMQMFGAHLVLGNSEFAEKEREIAHMRLDAYLDRRAANITKARL